MLTIIENCEPDEAQMRLVMRGTYQKINKKYGRVETTFKVENAVF